jgi:hypothetical protein
VGRLPDVGRRMMLPALLVMGITGVLLLMIWLDDED